MRIRTIKPEFWDHPVMGKQSDATKLLAIGLLNIADDEGYFYADPKLIRNAVRPFDDDSRIVTVSLRELSKIEYIEVKIHPTHGEIGKVVSFLDHQVINKPKASKLKALHEYGIDTVSIPDGYRLEGKGMEGNGMELLSEVSDVNGYSPFVETLWKAFPPKSRNRSAKKKLQDEWKKVKPKPEESLVIDAVTKWAVSDDWTKDNGQFAPGAHLWIKDRKWESLPEAAAVQFKGRGAWT